MCVDGSDVEVLIVSRKAQLSGFDIYIGGQIVAAEAQGRLHALSCCSRTTRDCCGASLEIFL